MIRWYHDQIISWSDLIMIIFISWSSWSFLDVFLFSHPTIFRAAVESNQPILIINSYWFSTHVDNHSFLRASISFALDFLTLKLHLKFEKYFSTSFQGQRLLIRWGTNNQLISIINRCWSSPHLYVHSLFPPHHLESYSGGHLSVWDRASVRPSSGQMSNQQIASFMFVTIVDENCWWHFWWQCWRQMPNVLATNGLIHVRDNCWWKLLMTLLMTVFITNAKCPTNKLPHSHSWQLLMTVFTTFVDDDRWNTIVVHVAHSNVS